MSKSNSSTDNRVRNWDIIVYPESAPDNWREVLEDLHIQWVESPLHDQDINPSTHEPKKAHYHVLLMFHGKKSYEQVCEFIAPLNCPIPQRCHDATGTIRYFAHLDNPDKHQYSTHDIVAHGGLDVTTYLQKSTSERYAIIRDMFQWCQDSNITEFCDLVDYAMMEHYDDWYPILCDKNTLVIKTYLQSRHFKEYKDFKESYNPYRNP